MDDVVFSFTLDKSTSTELLEMLEKQDKETIDKLFNGEGYIILSRGTQKIALFPQILDESENMLKECCESCAALGRQNVCINYASPMAGEEVETDYKCRHYIRRKRRNGKIEV